MDLTEVKAFLDKEKNNEEVKAFLRGFERISEESVNQFLDTEEGYRLLLPRLHSHFDRTLVSWKANNLEKEFETRLKDEIAIRYPEDTEDRKRIKDLERAKKDTDSKLLRAELKSEATTFLSEANLPQDLMEHLIGTDEEKTLKNLEAFKTMMDSFQVKNTDDIYKKHGREPKEGVELTPLEDLDKQLKTAMDKGDMLTAMKLHDKIFELRKS